jgi:protein tyrosine phosphatase (PTP) superfamily phosphohydrolase (DUF442 family)
MQVADNRGAEGRRKRARRGAPVVWLLAVLAGAPWVMGMDRSAHRFKPLAVGAARAAEYPGLQNVFRVSEKLYSGAVPEGATGFASLRALGIRTVITVDGARPDVVAAQRFGLRYVHLPFGYDGCPTPRALEITRAVRDLPGPIYLHCHHGQHRSPAAAALVHIALDGASNQEAVQFMKRAGTAPGYLGLYGAAASFRRPSKADIDGAPGRFPEVAEVPPLAEAMVQIDERFEALRQSQREGWRLPRQHPDILPPHEALQLKELFRELRRTDGHETRPPDYQGWMRISEQSATELEAALRAGDHGRADIALSQASATCGACHARYRNVPQVR